MKYNIAALLSVLMFLVAGCGGSGTKFAPKERKTAMTETEREAAIAAKKASFDLNVDSMLNSNGVKLSVLPPAPNGEITASLSERIGIKMLGVIAANGIGGVNDVPGFVLAAYLQESGRQTTGSAPQKYVIKYEIFYQVMNVTDGAVYGSVSESISGVGNSFQEAASNAVNEIKSTKALQSMLADASNKIIDWYEQNFLVFKAQVEEAMGVGNYALALAYLRSVPAQATEAFTYAVTNRPDVLRKFKAHNAAAELVALKSAIAAGNQSTTLDNSVYTHLAMIPEDSPEYKQAVALVENYEKRVLSRQEAAEVREISVEDAIRIHEQQMEMAHLQADKSIAIAQAKASEQAMRQHMRDKDDAKRNFWGNLGARIISGIDYLTDKSTDTNSGD